MIDLICVKNQQNSFFFIYISFWSLPLRSGIGISINKKEAAYYSKSAADKGFIDAINIYDDMLKNNEGITKNLKEATKYYKLAVDIGDVDSMYQYALLSDDDNKNN